MTMGVGRGEDVEKKGGFDFGMAVDGTYIAFDKPSETAHAPKRTDDELAEMIQSKRLSQSSLLQTTDAVVPDHVQLVGQKMHFRAYFNEAVTESPLEQYRTRYVIIRYYLEDDTVEMREPEIRNSGMSHGGFLKRMQHPAITLDTLRVGGDVHIYGRTMRVYECDDYARRFFLERGIEMEDNFSPPEDTFTKTKRQTDVDVFGGNHGAKMNNLKRYQESRLGKLIDDTDSKAKFLRYGNDKMVFRALWEDKATFGEKHLYSITYYLATDEVQIIEQKDSNAQVIFPMFLKRQRLARKPMVYDDRKASCEDGDGSEDYVNPDDFRVGGFTTVYKRDFLIYDCDNAAQKWYLENRGIDQQAGRVDVSEPVPVKPELPVPPPTGFGSEEDSLQSWKYLVPKTKPVDLEKLKNATGHTLKFQAKLVTSDEVDATRRFRITWYLDDDTLAIYEPPQRNSGVMGGAFAARKQYTNPETGKYFLSSEFFVGAEVMINRFKMEITEADDFSLRHMEKKSDLWPMSSVEFVMTNLKKKIQGQSASLRKMFRKFDLDHSQTISLEEFCNMLDYYGMGISKAEAVTIFRAFDQERTGLLSYDDFVSAFTDRDETGGVAAIDSRLHVELDTSLGADALADYEAAANAAADAEGQEAYLERLLQRVALAFRNSKAANILYQKFRQFDENKDNTVDRHEFRMAMGSGDDGAGKGVWHLSDKDVGLLEDKFFGDAEDVNYDHFIKVITDYADRMVRN